MKPTRIDRFWAKVGPREHGQCWEWEGTKIENGYGQFWNGARVVYAHRYSYELLRGFIPPKMDIDHICHNRACVNPAHLRICTRSENNRNQNIGARNTSGFKGVYWHKQSGAWQAQIKGDKGYVYLGLFSTPNSAHIAYRNAARTLHAEFANFGGPQ